MVAEEAVANDTSCFLKRRFCGRHQSKQIQEEALCVNLTLSNWELDTFNQHINSLLSSGKILEVLKEGSTYWQRIYTCADCISP